MNPKQFLTVGGIVLVLVALLGFFNVIGPTATNSIFGSNWYFDNYENWAHLILGIVALIAAFMFTASVNKTLTIIVGVVALFFALYNFFSTNFYGANLESPLDLILHAIIGVWALVAAFGEE